MYQIYKRFILIIITLLLVISCGIYSFTGSSIPVGVQTFQVDYFENTAGGKPGSTIEPGLVQYTTQGSIWLPVGSQISLKIASGY